MRRALLLVAAVGTLALAGCDHGTTDSSDGVSPSDQATLSSVEATVGAVESQVATDGGS